MPTRRVWLGHAPDVPQIDVVEFDEDECTILAERSYLELEVNDKVIAVRAPDSVLDKTPEAPGDSGALVALLQAAEATINGSTIPEFAELEASLESPDASAESPYHRLNVTTRPQFMGVPFELIVPPKPTIDVDVVQEGGPGRNEIQRFWFVTPPSGGTYQVLWDLGAGIETSGPIAFDADAAGVLAGIVAGMTSLGPDDVTVEGSGTEADPLLVTLTEGGALDETAVDPLIVNTDGLTGNGQVFTATVQEGGGGNSDELQYLRNYPQLSSTFRLGFLGQISDVITMAQAGAESAASVQAKLEALSTIGAGNIEVYGGRSIAAPNGNPATWAFLYLFRFKGVLADVNQPNLTIHHATSLNQVGTVFSWKSGGTASDDETYVLFTDHTSGTLTLTYDGQTTAGISFNLTDTIAKLEDLSNIAVGDVTGQYGFTSAPSYSQALALRFVNTLGGTNLTDLTANFGGLSGGTFATLTKVMDGGLAGGTNEIQSIYTNGVDGEFTLTKPGGATSDPLAPSAPGTEIKAALEDIYGGTVTVTGSGIPNDPWIAEFGGALAGTDQPLVEEDGTNLTGGFTAEIETVQDGTPPLPQIWDVTIHCTTNGVFAFSFKGRRTANIDYGSAHTVVQAALEALAPGDFTGLWTVDLVDTDVYRITVAGWLAGTPQQLIAHDDGLIGMELGIFQSTRQAATGRNWIDNPVNWRDVTTGNPGLPETGDEAFVQTGDITNSLRYGSLAGRLLKRFILGNMFRGGDRAPRRTKTGYVEYRPTHIALEFEDGTQSFDNPNIVIGVEQGQGSGLVRLKSADDEVYIRIERTGGPAEDGRPSFCWDGQNAASTLQLIEGTAGVAVFAFGTAQLAKAVQRGGALRFGEGTEIGAGGFDRVGGETLGRATIGGVPIIFGS